MALVPTEGINNALTAFWDQANRSIEATYTEEVDLFMSHPIIEAILDRISDKDEEDASREALTPYHPIGYVYAAWNPLFSDLIKIGATTRTQPYLRIRELSGTGVPEPFQMVSMIATPNPFALEREIHAHHAGVRKYGKKKEFFLISRDDIIQEFHMRSMFAMMQKPAPATADACEKRKHRSCFSNDEERTDFKTEIRNFLTRHIKESSLAFTSTIDIQQAFQQCHKDIQFSPMAFQKELKKQIQITIPNAQVKQVYAKMGYMGIVLQV